MSPLLWGIAGVMAIVLVANVALLATAVWLSTHPRPKHPLTVLQGGTARRRRPVPHRDRSRA